MLLEVSSIEVSPLCGTAAEALSEKGLMVPTKRGSSYASLANLAALTIWTLIGVFDHGNVGETLRESADAADSEAVSFIEEASEA